MLERTDIATIVWAEGHSTICTSCKKASITESDVSGEQSMFGCQSTSSPKLLTDVIYIIVQH